MSNKRPRLEMTDLASQLGKCEQLANHCNNSRVPFNGEDAHQSIEDSFLDSLKADQRLAIDEIFNKDYWILKADKCAPPKLDNRGQRDGSMSDKEFYLEFANIDPLHNIAISDAKNLLSHHLSIISRNDDWKKTILSLSEIRKISAVKEFHALFSEKIYDLIDVFNTLAKELRSSVIRESSITFSFLAVNLKSIMDPVFLSYCPIVVKMLASYPKVMKTAVTISLKICCINVHSLKLFESIYKTSYSSSKEVRRNSIECILEILNNWPDTELTKIIDQIFSLLKKSLSDADGDVRKISKNCCQIISKKYPKKFQTFFETLDRQSKKLASDEQNTVKNISKPKAISQSINPVNDGHRVSMRRPRESKFSAVQPAVKRLSVTFMNHLYTNNEEDLNFFLKRFNRLLKMNNSDEYLKIIFDAIITNFSDISPIFYSRISRCLIGAVKKCGKIYTQEQIITIVRALAKEYERNAEMHNQLIIIMSYVEFPVLCQFYLQISSENNIILIKICSDYINSAMAIMSEDELENHSNIIKHLLNTLELDENSNALKLINNPFKLRQNIFSDSSFCKLSSGRFSTSIETPMKHHSKISKCSTPSHLKILDKSNECLDGCLLIYSEILDFHQSNPSLCIAMLCDALIELCSNPNINIFTMKEYCLKFTKFVNEKFADESAIFSDLLIKKFLPLNQEELKNNDLIKILLNIIIFISIIESNVNFLFSLECFSKFFSDMYYQCQMFIKNILQDSKNSRFSKQIVLILLVNLHEIRNHLKEIVELPSLSNDYCDFFDKVIFIKLKPMIDFINTPKILIFDENSHNFYMSYEDPYNLNFSLPFDLQKLLEAHIKCVNLSSSS